ncbi:phage tail protein [Gallaecimonas xiamenensis]|uniref:Membrane protein n=1 Tax=Gallaecimonas xiamenensis 3-C-1 TaxID=745411 RepID=K2KD62_9GAMM|nr:hypothetical protein [Gallaecimonas xiamenensis]EKE75180.1 Membrane protein [Gallaecimonas xiamenensis 3-C-1]
MPPVVVGVAAYYAAAGVVTTAAAIAIGIGAAALTYAATPDVSGMSYSNAANSQQQMIRSPNEPRRYVYGRAMVSGPMVFASESGADNKYLHLVVPLATHRCDAVESVYFDDKVAWSSSTGMASEYAGKARIKVHLGDQTTADPDLVAECSDWTAEHVGREITYFYVRLEHDTEVFPNGVPNIKALLRGKPVYDPRLDSTVGGTGSHRWNDPSTWEWSDNWGLCVLDFTRFSSGIGAEQDEIDLDTFAAAANDSDQPVYTDAENVERRFTCNGTWQADQTPSTILEQMLTAGLGTHVYVYGQYRLYAGVYQGPPVVTLTEDDAAGQITVRPYTPRSELCNAVRGTFVDPDQAYQPTDFPPVESAELQADDNGEYIDDDLDLPFTQSVWTAQRLAKLYLLQKRSGLQITFPIKMIGLSVSVGRIVNINLPRLNLAGVFRVDDWTFEMGKPVQLVLTYHSAELFENADTGGTPLVPASPVNYPDGSVVPTPSNVTFTAFEPDASLLGQLSWDAPGGSNAYRYRVEVSSGELLAYQANPSGSVLPLPRLDAGNYTVRIWAINLFGNRSNTPAEIALAVDTAPPVIGIDAVASLFELAIYPRTAVATATSTVFTVLGGTNNDRGAATELGTGKSVVWTGRRADTPYYVWARSVNDYGISAWYGPVELRTSANTDALTEALEGKLSQAALDANLQQTLDHLASTADQIDQTLEQYDQQISDAVSTAQGAADAVELQQQTLTALGETQEQQQGLLVELQRADLSSAERISLLQVLLDNAQAQMVEQERVSAEGVQRMVKLSAQSDKAASTLTEVQEVTDTQAQTLLQLKTTQEGQTAQLTQISETTTDLVQQQAQLTLDVEGQQGSINALQGLFVDVDGNLVARGGWVSDSNGLLNGVLGFNDGQVSQLDILANVFRLIVKRANGTTFEGLKVNLANAADPVLEFAGRILAGTKIESPVVNGGTVTGGLLRGGRLEMVGSSHMTVMAATPFGPDNLLEWYGPRTGSVDGAGNPVLTALTKARAVSYRDNAGDEGVGGTITVDQIIGNVTNIQRVAAPPTGYWYRETISHASAVSWRKALTLKMPAVAHDRYVSLMNLQMGINNSNTTLGTSFGGQVQARLKSGTVLKTWYIALDGTAAGGDGMQAGHLVEIVSGALTRQIRDLFLPAGQGEVQFWITIDVPAGSGVTSYDLVASVGWPGVTNSLRAYGPFVDITSILAGSQSGVTLT